NRDEVAMRAAALDLPKLVKHDPSVDEIVEHAEKVADDYAGLEHLAPKPWERDDPELAEALAQAGDGSGNWYPSGVRNNVWERYRTDNPQAYVRACQAAFDLRNDS